MHNLGECFYVDLLTDKVKPSSLSDHSIYFARCSGVQIPLLLIIDITQKKENPL